MSILGFTADDIISILQLGISGVAFIFLAMSYSLLRKEQEREKEPRREILDSIRQFSILSFAFAILVAGISIYDSHQQLSETNNSSCTAAIERSKLLSADKNAHTLDTVYELLNNTISQCE